MFIDVYRQVDHCRSWPFQLKRDCSLHVYPLKAVPALPFVVRFFALTCRYDDSSRPGGQVLTTMRRSSLMHQRIDRLQNRQPLPHRIPSNRAIPLQARLNLQLNMWIHGHRGPDPRSH